MINTKLIGLLLAAGLILNACTKENNISEEGNLVPKTAEHDPTVPAIAPLGYKIHTEAFGHPDSNLVICLHGGPGSDYRYMLNIKDLAENGYRVVFYDQIGSGLTQRFPAKHYSDRGLAAIDDFYAELTAVIDHYKTREGQQVFLVGDSWGGMMGSGFAGKYPDKVDGLVVMEPGGLKWVDIFDYIKRSRSFGYFGETINDAAWQDEFISGATDEHAVLDYKFIMLAAKNDITREEPALFWRPGAVVASSMIQIGLDYSPDFSIGLNNFDPKVLYFHSEYNKAHPPSWAEKISSAYKNVELVMVNGTGHSGFVASTAIWNNITKPKLLTYFKSL